jgi:hypothetical protein
LARRSPIYGRLLVAAGLDDRHKQALIARGFAAEQISNRSYRTLPKRGRYALSKAACEGEWDDLLHVPGFHQKDGNNGPYWTLGGSPGLLIPCLDARGRVRGLRIRPDEQGDGGKYRWLSSADKPGGAGSGVHCHVARPRELDENEPLYVTEGELKADYSADKLGAVVISIPGVGNWAKALPDIAELSNHGTRIAIALDSDADNNPAVGEARWNLAQATDALGYKTKVATWTPEFKGIDDLLVTGQKPEMKSPGELPSTNWTPKQTARTLTTAKLSAKRMRRISTARNGRMKLQTPALCA